MTNNDNIDEMLKNTDIQAEILKDLLEDNKKTKKNIINFFIFVIIILISLFIYYDFSNKSFMSSLDLKNTSITNDANLKGDGQITDINKVNISK